MSLTSCWIFGEYCLGAPSSGGEAMASEGLAGLVFRCRTAHRAGVWSRCLEQEEKNHEGGLAAVDGLGLGTGCFSQYISELEVNH